MDRCLFCQGEVDGMTRQCRQCGCVQPAQFTSTLLDAPPLLIIRCPACDALLPAQAQFCGTCGRKVTLPPEQPPGGSGTKQPGPPLPGNPAETWQQGPSASPSPATVFLSYSHLDDKFIPRLQSELRAQGIHIWIDHEGLKPGTPDWEEAVRNAIRKADALVLVASPNSRQSPYVKDELRIAAMYRRPVYPLWADGEEWMEAIPIGWGGTQYIDARGTTYASGAQQLVEALLVLPARRSGLLAGSSGELEPLFEPRNPYKGLRAFSAQDAQDFFGREKLIEELNRELRRLLVPEQPGSASNRLLAIIGPSGSGKSSVVMAGILPRLQAGVIPGSHKWIYLAPMIPGRHPIEALALTLSPHFSARELNSILKDLEGEDARGLHQLAASLTLQSDAKVVLFVDQFEELFTQTTAEKERQRFIDLLLTAATEPRGPLIVLLALRADFYDRPAQYPELARLLQKYHQLVLPMDLKDLHRVIEGPATLLDVQVKFQGDLVGDMLFEGQGQVGTLPLLQFTLDQLFQRRRGHLLTEQAYREMGGVKGALSQHAEETYQALPSDEHRQMARDVFLRLVVPGATGQDAMRRRAARSEFEQADPMQTQHMQETLEAFISARLLTSNRVGGITTVEVSHEALIREWERLAEWLGEARDDILLQQSLSDDVTEWEQRKRPRDRLYRGAQLKEAQTWARRNRQSEQEAAFLRASVARRIQSLVGLILVVLLLVSSLGIAGWKVFFQPQPTLVTTLQDNNEAGSLRWCINNAPSGSTIRFAQGVRGTIELTGGGLVFVGGKTLTIVGPGANQLTISGGNTNAHIHVSEGAMLTIHGLSFKNSETLSQAFLINEGTLIITDSIISGNKAIASSGASYGGGIYNLGTGTLTVSASIFSSNLVSGHQISRQPPGSVFGQGGGIDNEGKLTVTGSTFSNNTAIGDESSFGGAICNTPPGTAIVTHSTFSNNSSISKQKSSGGSIENGGKLTVTGSTFSNNTASGNDSYGGGIHNYSTGILTVFNSTFSKNSANGQQGSIGGGIYNQGKLTMTHSTFSDNSASSQQGSIGGGIANGVTATLMVTNSTFSDNSAIGQQGSIGGGIANHGTATLMVSTFSDNSASSQQDGAGGGIYNEGNLMVTNSTFSDNSASGNRYGFGGGIYSTGVLTVVTSTLSNNSASGQQGGTGGGIVNAGKLTVVTSTLSNNSASGQQGGTGGGITFFDNIGSSTIIRFSTIYGNTSSAGGGITVFPTGRDDMKISSSIIVANSAHDGPDILGALISDGYNLITNFTGAKGPNARTDRQVKLADLKMDPTLRNNGGPTQTLALLPGSLAIDAVPGQACSITVTDVSGHTVTITTDQRGDPRADGSENACDIGAFESSYSP